MLKLNSKKILIDAGKVKYVIPIIPWGDKTLALHIYPKLTLINPQTTIALF